MSYLERFELAVLPIADSNQLTDELARQIVANSRQRHIRDTTRDAIERFSTVDAVRARFDDGQYLLPLVHEPSNELAGLAWFRPKAARQAPWAELTYAHRLYKNYLHKGFSTPFAHVAHQQGYVHYGDKDVWLQTELTKERAIATYEAIGYRAVSQAKGVVTMAVSLTDFAPEQA